MKSWWRGRWKEGKETKGREGGNTGNQKMCAEDEKMNEINDSNKQTLGHS